MATVGFTARRQLAWAVLATVVVVVAGSAMAWLIPRANLGNVETGLEHVQAATLFGAASLGLLSGRWAARTSFGFACADETNDDVLYDGDLCSFAIGEGDQGGASSKSDQGVSTKKVKGENSPPEHTGVGERLPHTLKAGESIRYQIVIRPKKSEDGLPSAAQSSKTSLELVFTGFDY